MESLSMLISSSSSSPPLQPHLKTLKPLITSHLRPPFPSLKPTTTHLPFLLTTTLPLPSSAAATSSSDRINLESILTSVDEFFNKYPFFVASCAFLYLVVIPVVEHYLKKYKFISVLDAFRKLKENPEFQLLDIRDDKSSSYLKTPNLRIVNKDCARVGFVEADEEGFVKKVVDKFGDPANTVVCVLGNFDGVSIKVAELLVKSGGFKETYAIKGGVGGTKGWLESQETLLPPSMHMYPKKKVKTTKETGTNGGVLQLNKNGNIDASSSGSLAVSEKQRNNNGRITKSTEAVSVVQDGSRSSSPYPNYPDLKPPSSPTPSKPQS